MNASKSLCCSHFNLAFAENFTGATVVLLFVYVDWLGERFSMLDVTHKLDFHMGSLK